MLCCCFGASIRTGPRHALSSVSVAIRASAGKPPLTPPPRASLPDHATTSYYNCHRVTPSQKWRKERQKTELFWITLFKKLLRNTQIWVHSADEHWQLRSIRRVGALVHSKGERNEIFYLFHQLVIQIGGKITCAQLLRSCSGSRLKRLAFSLGTLHHALFYKLSLIKGPGWFCDFFCHNITSLYSSLTLWCGFFEHILFFPNQCVANWAIINVLFMHFFLLLQGLNGWFIHYCYFIFKFISLWKKFILIFTSEGCK